MQKFLSVILAFSFIFVFSACGNSSTSNFESTADSKNAAPEMAIESPMAMKDGASTEIGFGGDNKNFSATKTNSAPQNNRKLVKHSQMDLQTKEFDNAIDEILKTISDLDGYVEFQEISGNNLYSTRGNERYASINARIPVDNLDKAQNQISQLCNVLSQSSNIEDITDSYFDTDARLKSCKIKEERLLELLKKADTMKDIIEIEQSLSDVRFQIENLTSSIQRMDSQIAYSYLNLSISEVIEYDLIEDTFLQRIASSFKKSGKNIANWFENSAIFIIESLPVLILNLAVFAIIFYAVFLILRKFNLKEKIYKTPHNKDDNSSNDKTK